MLLNDIAFTGWFRNTPAVEVRELNNAKTMCLAEGDVMFASYVLLVKSYRLSMGPFPLKESLAEITTDVAFVKAALLSDTVAFLQAQQTDISMLMGYAAQQLLQGFVVMFTCFLLVVLPVSHRLCVPVLPSVDREDPSVTKAQILDSLSKSSVTFGTCLTAVGTVYSDYFLGRLAEALDACSIADATIDTMYGLFPYGVYQAFKGLTALKLARTLGVTDFTITCAETARTILAGLAVESPISFRSLHLLLEAETCSLKHSSYFQAIEMYDMAIKVASEDGMLHYHALACELAGSFYLRCSAPQTGMRLLADAMALYNEWGAAAVARRVQQEYRCDTSPVLSAIGSRLTSMNSTSLHSGSSSGSSMLDKANKPASLTQAVDFDATIKFCQVAAHATSRCHACCLGVTPVTYVPLHRCCPSSTALATSCKSSGPLCNKSPAPPRSWWYSHRLWTKGCHSCLLTLFHPAARTGHRPVSPSRQRMAALAWCHAVTRPPVTVVATRRLARPLICST